MTDHIPEFTKRGMCARDPKRAFVDGVNMRVPRKSLTGDQWKPYSPAAVRDTLERLLHENSPPSP